MKKNFLALLLLVTSCSINNNDKKKKEQNDRVALVTLAAISSQPKPCGGFWRLDFYTGNYTCSPAELKYSSNAVDVYIEQGLENKQSRYGLTRLNYTEIANTYSTIISSLQPAFGTMSDINQDGKLTVFIIDTNPKYTGGSFIAGYIDPANYIEDPGYGVDLRSNMREILYIDGFNLLFNKKYILEQKRPDPFYATLAHELQHLLRLPYELQKPNIQSYIPLPRTSAEASYFRNLKFDTTWINEGTSEVASDIAGYGPQYSRMECFLGDPKSSCEGFIGQQLLRWQSNIFNYSFSYAFMKYLYYNASSTTEGRNQFFLASLQKDSNGYRANTSKNLFELYKSTNNYNSTLLGSSNLDIYKKLYGLFLAQTLSYPTTANAYYGNNTATATTDLQTIYSYPSDLRELTKYPTELFPVTATQFMLEPSQVYRVKGTVTGTASDSVVIQGSGEYIIFNSSLEEKNHINATVTTRLLPDQGGGCGMHALHTNWQQKGLTSQLIYYGNLKNH